MSLFKTTTLLLAVAFDLAAQHDRFGTPACSGSGQEFADRSFFVICHSSDRKVPLWVGYELTPEHFERAATRPAHFRHDPDLSGASAYDSDYKNSGYSRGHMAPAADFAWSRASIRATFLLSNAIPQRQAVNQGRWAQMYAAIVPNAEVVREPLNQFAVTVDEIERRTGLDFFSALEESEERDLEGRLQLFPCEARIRLARPAFRN